MCRYQTSSILSSELPAELPVVISWYSYFLQIDCTVKCWFTLWYSCCLAMYIIWSVRWLRLFSRFTMLSLVFSLCGSIECSPIWTSKCSFCKTRWRKIRDYFQKSFISLYCLIVQSNIVMLHTVGIATFSPLLCFVLILFVSIGLTSLCPAKTATLVELVWKQK